MVYKAYKIFLRTINMNLQKLVTTNIKKLKHLFVPFVACFFLSSIALTINPYFTSRIIGCFNIKDKYVAIENILFWFILFIFLKLLQALNQYFLRITKDTFEATFNANITEHLFKHMHHHNTQYFDDEMTGRISTAITSFSSLLYTITTTILFQLIRPIINITFAFIIISVSSPKLAITLTILFIPFYFIEKKQIQKIITLWRTRSSLERANSGFSTDSLTNYKLVKYTGSIFSEKLNAFKLLKKYLRSTADCEVNRAATEFLFNATISFFFVSSYFAIIYFAIYDNLNLADIFFAFSVIRMLSNDLGLLSRFSIDFHQEMGEIKANLEIISKPIEIKDKTNALTLKIKQPSISYKDVCFSYIKGKEVFQNLNLDIKPYEKIGLVGLSGSGKSTLINLLLRSYAPQFGYISIDNKNIADITEYSLHKNISYVPQDVTLFNRSILENIKITSPKSTKEEIIHACKLAHIHDIIMSLPQGYESIVGERGILLSGGERQRIAIARAILHNAPILILDEATSALDSEAEVAIQKALDNLMQNKTVISIAHRLSTLRSMDRIIVLDKGKIIEDDNPKNLLKNKESTFKYFYSLQTDGYINLKNKGDK